MNSAGSRGWCRVLGMSQGPTGSTRSHGCPLVPWLAWLPVTPSGVPWGARWSPRDVVGPCGCLWLPWVACAVRGAVWSHGVPADPTDSTGTHRCP